MSPAGSVLRQPSARVVGRVSGPVGALTGHDALASWGPMCRILYRLLVSFARLAARSGRSRNLEIIVLEAANDAGHEYSASARIAASQRPRPSFRHPQVVRVGQSQSVERGGSAACLVGGCLAASADQDSSERGSGASRVDPRGRRQHRGCCRRWRSSTRRAPPGAASPPAARHSVVYGWMVVNRAVPRRQPRDSPAGTARRRPTSGDRASAAKHWGQVFTAGGDAAGVVVAGGD